MKFLLIHVPKTAGNSIIQTYDHIILKVWGHNIRVKEYRSFPEFLRSEQSKRPIRHFVKRLLNIYPVTFAVTRNTWDRIYSSYNFLKKGGKNELDQSDYDTYISPYADFEDFILNGLQKAKNEQIHFKPQTYWIANKNNKVVVDHLLEFSDINQELKLLMRQYGKEEKDLLIVNKHSDDSFNYRNKYSEKTKNVVKELYKAEIDLLGYEF